MSAPSGLEPPTNTSVLEVGEKLLWKYEETRYFGFFLWSNYCYINSINLTEKASLNFSMLLTFKPLGTIIFDQLNKMIIKYNLPFEENSQSLHLSSVLQISGFWFILSISSSPNTSFCTFGFNPKWFLAEIKINM